MEAFDCENLQAILRDTKLNNAEAIRLLQNEREFLLSNKTSLIINSNSARDNMGWIDTLLSQVKYKLESVDDDFSEWKIIQRAIRTISTENMSLKKQLFEEKRRTVSLYYSLNESVSVQQNQDSQIQDLNLKYDTLDEQYQSMLQKKKDMDDDIIKLNEQCSKLIKEEDLTKAKIIKSVNDDGLHDAKRQKLYSSSSSTPSYAKIHKGMDSTDLKKKTHNEDVIKDFTSRERYDELRGRRIRRNFPGHGIYVGTVGEYRHPYFSVEYEDGDKEEMNISEVFQLLVPE